MAVVLNIAGGNKEKCTGLFRTDVMSSELVKRQIFIWINTTMQYGNEDMKVGKAERCDSGV